MYASHGTNFSINPEVPAEGQSLDIEDIQRRLTQANPKASKSSATNQQVAEYLRNEAVGILNISSIAMKPPVDRDDSEKQFFVMFLKLRVAFFKDFDKKTLRLLMERMLCRSFLRREVVAALGAE